MIPRPSRIARDILGTDEEPGKEASFPGSSLFWVLTSSKSVSYQSAFRGRIREVLSQNRRRKIWQESRVHKATVHDVISSYNRLGVAAVETAGKGGRRHQYLTLEEEQEFLAPFFAQAQEGLIATTAEIWRAFETRVGHEVDDSTIYRLLHRHGWRQLMPRPRHPKADSQAQAHFKKTLQRRLKRQSQRAQPRRSVRC